MLIWLFRFKWHLRSLWLWLDSLVIPYILIIQVLRLSRIVPRLLLLLWHTKWACFGSSIEFIACCELPWSDWGRCQMVGHRLLHTSVLSLVRICLLHIVPLFKAIFKRWIGPFHHILRGIDRRHLTWWLIYILALSHIVIWRLACHRLMSLHLRYTLMETHKYWVGIFEALYTESQIVVFDFINVWHL